MVFFICIKWLSNMDKMWIEKKGLAVCWSFLLIIFFKLQGFLSNKEPFFSRGDPWKSSVLRQQVLSGKDHRQRNNNLKWIWKEDVKSQTNTYASLAVLEVVHVRKQRVVAVAWSRQYRDLFVTIPVCCTPNPQHF